MRTTSPKTALFSLFLTGLLGLSARAQSGSVSFDFDDGLVPAGTVIPTPAVIRGVLNPALGVTNSGGFDNTGCLILTRPYTVENFGQWWILTDMTGGQPVSSFTASFKLYMGNGTFGNAGVPNAGANGLVFHVGPQPPNEYPGSSSTWGNGLDVNFRTYNSSSNTPGINIAYNSVSPGFNPGGGTIIATNSFFGFFNTNGPADNFSEAVDVSLSVSNGLLNLTCSNALIGYVVVYTNLVIPGFAPLSDTNGAAPVFGFTASDGAGAHEDAWIDSVAITAYAPSGPISFLAEPVSQTGAENAFVTFTTAVTGSLPYYYQWLSNGVPVLGATNSSYTTPWTLYAMNGIAYSVTASNDSSGVISSNAILTVVQDTAGVQVASVGSLDGSSVGVQFSSFVDPATAGNPNNYLINGVHPTAATVRTAFANLGSFIPTADPVFTSVQNYLNYQKTVVLTPASPVSGSFNVTVNSSVKSRTGIAVVTTNLAGVVARLTDVDVGSPGSDPLATGEAFVGGSNQVEVIAGGSNLMPIGAGVADAGNFAYAATARSGNFDVVADLTFETATAGNAKAGLMVRPNVTSATGPAIALKVFPQAGNNYFETAFRPSDSAPQVSWAATGQPANGNLGAYWASSGNNWLRIRSLGGTYYGYVAPDGQTWTLLGQVTPDTNAFPYPTSEYVGLFACAANNDGRLCEADFSSWAATVFPTASIAITTNLHPNVTGYANTHQTFAIGASLSGGISASELVYQWQRQDPSGGAFYDLYGANAGSYTTPFLSVSDDNGAKYRVIVFAGDITTGHSTTSIVSTLTVNLDTTPPYMVSAYADPTFSLVTINFDGPMDGPNGANSLGTLTNYRLVNATNSSLVITIDSVTPVSSDGGVTYSSVQLALNASTPLVSGVKYTLTVSSVLDAAGNNINNTTVTGGKQRTVSGWMLAYGYLRYDRWFGASYPAGAGPFTDTVDAFFAKVSPLNNGFGYDPVYASSPNLTELITYSGYPNGDVSGPTVNQFDFSARISGFVIPPTTDNYNFYVRGNDSAALTVSSDSTPGSLLLRAMDDEPNGFAGSGRSWLYSMTNATAVSGVQVHTEAMSLTVGQPYYVEALEQQANGTSFLEFTLGIAGAATVFGGDNVTNVPGSAWPIGTSAPARGGAPTNSYNLTGNNIATFIDPDMSVITATGPSNTTAFAGSTAAFSVAATAVLSVAPASSSVPISYQWYKNGSIIGGATGASYTTPVLALADSNSVFSVAMSVAGVPFMAITNSATLSVLPQPVQVVSASSFGGNTIGIQYNQTMDAASVTNTANYTAVSGGLTVTKVQVRPDGRTVLLSLSGTLAGPTFSVTLNNIKGFANNPIAPNTVATGNVLFSQMSAIDIGVATSAAPPGVVQTNSTVLTNVTINLNYPGSTVMATDGVFQVVASGSDIGNNQDGFHYIYEQRTGDFDVKVHVERIDGSNAKAKAGLMMRQDLTPGGFHYLLAVEPPYTNAADGSGLGFNGVELLRRTTNNAPPTGFGNNPNPPILGNAGTGTNTYPIWLRMRRTGQALYVYTGADGTNWYLCGRVTALATGWGNTVYLGMAATARTNSLYTQAQFSQYGNFVAPGQKQVLLLAGGNTAAGGNGGATGNVTGGSTGPDSALSTPAGAPNSPANWNPSDAYLYNLLLNLGYNITVVHAFTSATEDASGKTLVMWSGSVQSGDAGSPGKFMAVPVPVVMSKYSSLEKVHWVSASGSRGNETGHTTLKIVDINNPIVTGGGYALGQGVVVASSSTYFGWGISNDFAHVVGGVSTGFKVVAVDPSSTTHAMIAYADAGTPIYSGGTSNNLAARSVFLWDGDNGATGNDGNWQLHTADAERMLTNSINWAVATMTNPPSVTAPASLAVAVGSTASFSVTASGGPAPYSYQWRSNGVAIASATAANYTTPATTLTDSGKQFTVVVTGLYGSVTSAVATLTVQTPINITSQPQNQAGSVGGTVAFSVGATGTSPGYQWYSNNVAVPSPGGSSYTTAPLTPANNNDVYRVVVTNLVSSMTSSNATVTILPPPAISGFALLNSSHLSINWSNGTGTSVLLSSTNAALAMTNWIPVVTNPTLPYTITIDPTKGQNFYRVKQ